MSQKITEKTLIPISLVITLSGGIYWLSTIYIQGIANAKDIAEMKSDQKDSKDFVRSVDMRLSHIEGKLGINEK